MQRKNAKHMRFKGYADGGKVKKSESEYGTPTFVSAVKARWGFSDDGYGNPLPTFAQRNNPRIVFEDPPDATRKRTKAND